MITIFKNYAETKKPHHITLEIALERIKSGGVKAKIEEIRKETDEKKRIELKKTLPCVLFSGKFSARNKEGCDKHSGLIVLDYDHCNVKEKKKELANDLFVCACWISPSGNGIKALVKLPEIKQTGIDADLEHKCYFRALEKQYPGIDNACKDVSRITYESYDPDLIVNPLAKVWTSRIEEKKDLTAAKAEIKASHTDYTKVNIPLNMIRNAVDGEKHVVLLRASRLMGGYVAAGRVEEQEAYRLLEQEISKKDITDSKSAELAIRDGIENGKQDPIEETEKIEKSYEPKLGKIYFTLKDVEGDINQKYEHGISRGYYMGYECLHKNYSIKLGCTTYLYGAPYSGKSQVWFQFLINLSRKYDMKHAVFSPEAGDSSDVYIELLELAAGKDFYKDYNNRMNQLQYDQAKKFIDTHFIIIDPQDKVFTIDDFLEYITIIERQYNIKIHTATGDPFNEFHHKDPIHRDLYIENLLGDIRKNARAYNRHICLITHVRDQKIEVQNGIRFYPPATPREVSGGQAWYRKGHGMISIWRPSKGLVDPEGQPYPENTTILYVQKAKPMGAGKKGEARLYWDAKRHRYYEDEDVDPSQPNEKDITLGGDLSMTYSGEAVPF